MKTQRSAVLALALILPACGGSAGPTSTSAPAPPPPVVARLEMVSAPPSPIRVNSAGTPTPPVQFVFDCTLPDGRTTGALAGIFETASGATCYIGGTGDASAITPGVTKRYVMSQFSQFSACRPSGTSVRVVVACGGEGRLGVQRTFELSHLWTP